MDSGVGYTPIRLEQLTRYSVSVTFGYDPDGLLTQAGAISLGRDPQTGLVTGTTLGSLTDTRSYSTSGEVASYQAAFGGATGCPRDSQGSSASVGLQIGNLSYDASWESGLLWYTDKDGSLRTVYHERSTPLALSFTKKFGVGVGGYFNPFEFGWAGY